MTCRSCLWEDKSWWCFACSHVECFEHKLTAEGRKTGFCVLDHYEDNSQLELASWPTCWHNKQELVYLNCHKGHVTSLYCTWKQHNWCYLYLGCQLKIAHKWPTPTSLFSACFHLPKWCDDSNHLKHVTKFLLTHTFSQKSFWLS